MQPYQKMNGILSEVPKPITPTIWLSGHIELNVTFNSVFSLQSFTCASVPRQNDCRHVKKKKNATLNISAKVHFEDSRTVHIYFLSANKTSNE